MNGLYRFYRSPCATVWRQLPGKVVDGWFIADEFDAHEPPAPDWIRVEYFLPGLIFVPKRNVIIDDLRSNS